MSQPPGYPPPYPPGAPYPTPRTNGRAVAVMVLGIVGLALFCSYGIGIIPAIVALALAPGARREIEASNGWQTGLSQVKAGVVCSWVAVGLGIAAAIALIIIAIASAASSR